jgi:diaminohydroxyphosphoribosylaminopyrimidine deaminase/5-amino-6-(5-phosphoribosylamino)uracil reductase
MIQALALSATARRRAAPNPWVGCVVVQDGMIVGEGATEAPGGRHAEIGALVAAGERARGATVYTTLEPCVHHGRTAPCTDALIGAGVARVVVALDDPDPRVAGAGIERLRSHGIVVDVGEGAARARRDLEPYLVHRTHGRSFVVVKTAASIDGRIAARDGSSRWITGAAARADAHELRADSQAIVIGSGTALADHPALTVRDVEVRPAEPPMRVVLDARGRVPATGPLFDAELAPIMVVTTTAAPGEVERAWLAAGAKVLTVPAAAGAVGVDVDATFEVLAGFGVVQALVEGGGRLAGALVTGASADRLVAYVAPVVLGREGLAAFDVPGPATIGDAERYELVGARRLGSDVRLDYSLRPPPWPNGEAGGA